MSCTSICPHPPSNSKLQQFSNTVKERNGFVHKALRWLIARLPLQSFLTHEQNFAAQTINIPQHENATNATDDTAEDLCVPGDVRVAAIRMDGCD